MTTNVTAPSDEEEGWIREAKEMFRFYWRKAGRKPHPAGERSREPELHQLITLAKRLKGVNQFGYARRLFKYAQDHADFTRALRDEAFVPSCGRIINGQELRHYLPQQVAICTYKDAELSARERFDQALKTLNTADLLDSTTNQETLGLAGAIHKRRWEVGAQQRDLERAFGYYLRGYQAGLGQPDLGDHGYTGINAAFVLDLITRQELLNGGPTATVLATANANRIHAAEIRGTIRTRLEPLWTKPLSKMVSDNEWWFNLTLVEAHLGLEDLDGAARWLDKSKERLRDHNHPVQPWMLESAAQQLASLVRIQIATTRLMSTAPAGSEAALSLEQDLAQWEARAWNLLRDAFTSTFTPDFERPFVGKLGLALSGGGFRASLFHIGVLAYLAERDVLRNVEVLSCVSGGSILGAHYYLEIRQLLETTRDGKITREHYLRVVENLVTHFLAGVQTNIRSRLLGEFTTSLGALFLSEDYRTRRLGELYEKHLYARVADGAGAVRWLSDLFVQPCEDIRPFRPKYDNWRRKNKVPILVLNATTINTGHNWQFTASWMGEPPGGIDPGIDGNYRLRRMYYREAPEPYKRLRLGLAVAASSCVPGLFEPLMLRGLYPGKHALLVDGGVHDNQGVSSLLEQDCAVMIVSDASGQMGTQDHPEGGRLDVLFRTNDMLMGRVRQAEYEDLEARQSTGLLRGRLFLHLKKDLPVEPVDWKECDDPMRPAGRPGDAEPQPATPYGIPVEFQRHLAAVRTDLDAFSEVEAYALMASGYRMAETHFDQDLPGAAPAPEPPPRWRFLELEVAMLAPGAAGRDVLRQICVGREKVFRIWRLSPILSILAGLLGIGAIIALGRLWLHHSRDALHTSVGTLGLVVSGAIAGIVIGRLLIVVVRNRVGMPVGRFGAVNLVLLLAFLAFKLHRYLGLNWLSLKRGSLKRVLSLPR